MGFIWTSGRVSHGGGGQYHLQMVAAIHVDLRNFMIRASREPENHSSLTSFVIWSSVVDAGVMAAQALGDGHENGHFLGDVPALLLVAVVLGYLHSGDRQPQDSTI